MSRSHTLFGTRTNRLGRTYLARSFNSTRRFVCRPLRSQCVAARYGAAPSLHPQEALLHSSGVRALLNTVGCTRRSEHPLARLVQLGVRNLATSAEPRPDSNYSCGHG